MIYGMRPYAFIMPGHATVALNSSEQAKLTERFMTGDFGIASFTEKAANRQALRRGGEIVGRYLFKGETWVAWGKIAAPRAAPDLSPGYLLHWREYRDKWHLGPEHMKIGPDYPPRPPKEEREGNEPNITIMACPDEPEEERLQIGYTEDNSQIVMRTAEHTYSWQIDMMTGIITGLRAAAAGDPFPAMAHGMVACAEKRLIPNQPTIEFDGVTLSDPPGVPSYENVGGKAAMVIDCKSMSYLMPKYETLRLADGFEEVYNKLREGNPA
jgi:hypothetical protein